jgi:hypothetical protein
MNIQDLIPDLAFKSWIPRIATYYSWEGSHVSPVSRCFVATMIQKAFHNHQAASHAMRLDLPITETPSTHFWIMNTSIEFSGLTQWLADKIGLPQPVLFALTIGALLGWVCWRTRSTHIVITRI